MPGRLRWLAVRVLLDLAVIALILAAAAFIAVTYFFYGPPLITVANGTGADLRGVIVEVNSGCTHRFQLDMPRGSKIERRVEVCGEGTTVIEWTDSAGVAHRENGQDYLEGYRGYRSFVIILPDGHVAQIFLPISSDSVTVLPDPPRP